LTKQTSAIIVSTIVPVKKLQDDVARVLQREIIDVLFALLNFIPLPGIPELQSCYIASSSKYLQEVLKKHL